jgi:NADH-quinone oxidoreductase subunit N
MGFLILRFRVQIPIYSFSLKMMSSQIVRIADLHIFEELFLGISLLYLISYGSFISFNSKYNHVLFNRSFLNLVLLVLLLGGYLSFKGDYSCCMKSLSFYDAVSVDSLSYIVKNSLTLFSVLFLILIKEYVFVNKINNFEYFVLLLFAILGLVFLCSCNDFITMFLSLELQSLSFYTLAALKKRSSYSIDSGLKYFVVGSFASGIFLFGISLVYGTVGSINFTEINELKLSDIVSMNKYGAHIILEDNPVFYFSHDFLIQNTLVNSINIGFFFIFVSLFIKISIAPFHLWSPDVYENAPTSSSFFFIMLPKLSLFFVIVKLSYFCSFGSLIFLKELLFVFILFSISFGAFGGFEQRKIKSLLVYSSISHLGYLLLCLTFESFESLFALFSYLFVYTGSGICLWGLLLLLRLKRTNEIKSNKDLSDLVLLIKSNKVFFYIFSSVLFSLAGLPPLLGFLVKLNVLLITVQNNGFLIACISIFFSVISLFYYIRIVKVLCFEPVIIGKLYEPINTNSIMIPIVILYIILYVFINPSLFYAFLYRACLCFF